MSAHFSKFLLNTYSGTPYFQANVPADYPVSLVLQKSRAFRRLPPNLRQLSALAKRWAIRNGAGIEGIGDWYDEAGQELDPTTHRPLTDAQIDSQWLPDSTVDELKVKDIPVPDGGFPDPGTWHAPAEATGEQTGDDELTESQILSDIAGHGRARTAAEYGVSAVELAGAETDAELARLILDRV